MNPILQQLPSDDDTLSSSAAEFFHTFDVGRLFTRSARSKKGVGAFKILQFLFALVFLKKSFFDMMQQKSLPTSKEWKNSGGEEERVSSSDGSCRRIGFTGRPPVL